MRDGRGKRDQACGQKLPLLSCGRLRLREERHERKLHAQRVRKGRVRLGWKKAEGPVGFKHATAIGPAHHAVLARVGRGAKRHGSFANALKKPRIQPVHDDGLGQRLGRGPGRHFKQGLDTRLIADQLGPVAGKARRAVAGEKVGICAVDLRTGFGEIVHKIEFVGHGAPQVSSIPLEL